MVDGGDLAAGNLSELGQQVQHLQTSHQEHEVREGEEHRHLPVRVLVHVLADQHSVVVHFAKISQDLHRCRTPRENRCKPKAQVAGSDVEDGKPTSHFEKPVPGHQAFGDCVENQMSRPKVDWIQLELRKIKRTFISSFRRFYIKYSS